MVRPRAVLFDAGNTLFREAASRARIYCETAARHGFRVSESVMAAAMKSAHESLPSEIEGHFRYSTGWFERFIETAYALAGYSGPLHHISRDLFAAFDRAGTFFVFPDVRPVIKRIKGAGIPMGVVSNWSPRLPALLGRLGLRRDFDVVIASAVQRREKPDPLLFLRAVGELGVEPADAVFVGDHPEKDVDGAHAAGLSGILLDREGIHRDHAERISSLYELLPRIGLDAAGLDAADPRPRDGRP